MTIIELARTERKNPAVPEWLEKDYFSAIRELALAGASEILPVYYSRGNISDGKNCNVDQANSRMVVSG